MREGETPSLGSVRIEEEEEKEGEVFDLFSVAIVESAEAMTCQRTLFFSSSFPFVREDITGSDGEEDEDVENEKKGASRHVFRFPSMPSQQSSTTMHHQRRRSK